MGGHKLGKPWAVGNYKNNCPLFVWGNPGNFMKSVIRQRNSISLYLLEDIVMKQEIKMKVWPVF